MAALCALIFCFLPLNAQILGRFDNKYYVSAWGALGYANLVHGNFFIPDVVPKISAAGGVGGLLGVGFEYNHKRFILTFGAEFDYKLSNTIFKKGTHMDVGKIVDSETRKEIGTIGNADNPFLVGVPEVEGGVRDTEGELFVMHYNFKRYTDTYHSMYVNIPLLMGAQFANRFYFLMGGKVGLHIETMGYVSTAYRTTATYPRFINDMGQKSMPDHFLDDFKSKASASKIDLGLNIVASAEIGKVFVPQKKKVNYHYRIAAFADYGVLNVHKNISYGDPINISANNAVALEHINILASHWALRKAVNPLLVGVKFTILLDLGNKEPCNCIPEHKSKWQNQNNTRSTSISTNTKTKTKAKKTKIRR